MRTITHGSITWLDVVKPSDEDIATLSENYGFHPLILEEIKTPTYHPLLEVYEKYLVLILHFPHLNTETDRIEVVEVDFLITKEALITVRYQSFSDFERFFEQTTEEGRGFAKTTGHLFHHIVKDMIKQTFPELDAIAKTIDELEDQIFDSIRDEDIEEIAHTKRKILDTLRALSPQASVWDAAQTTARQFWGDRMKPYTADLIADYHRALNVTQTHLDALDAIHHTASSLLESRQNRIMKTLTIFTAVMLPLTLVTSVYGMNVAKLPGADNPMMFWWLVWSLLSMSVAIMSYFSFKRWL